MDDLVLDGGGEGQFLKVDFICLKGQYPVILNGIDVYERANQHLNIEVSVFQYDTENEDDNLKDKKRVKYSAKALSIESVKHWVWLF